MSHDITAFKPGIDRDELRRTYNLDEHDEGWFGRYDAYEEAVQIASLSRGATNPLNLVIYKALGVVEEAYAGVSGNGVSLNITFDQFMTAREVLKNYDFSQMPIEKNFAHSLTDMFSQLGATVIETGEPNKDITPEVRFVDACLEFMLREDLTELSVSFA